MKKQKELTVAEKWSEVDKAIDVATKKKKVGRELTDLEEYMLYHFSK